MTKRRFGVFVPQELRTCLTGHCNETCPELQGMRNVHHEKDLPKLKAVMDLLFLMVGYDENTGWFIRRR